jgi:hypothetical protein
VFFNPTLEIAAVVSEFIPVIKISHAILSTENVKSSLVLFVTEAGAYFVVWKNVFPF